MLLLDHKQFTANSDSNRNCVAVSAYRYNHAGLKCPDPVTTHFRGYRDFGALTEQLEQLVNDSLKDRASEVKSDFRDVMFIKSMQSQSHPGEPVGLLAAQVK
jgi:hypothetical protein